MRTLITYPGAEMELELADAGDWRAGAAKTKREAGCESCGHHRNAHRTGSCSVLIVPADKRLENIANGRKCGCAAMKQQGVRKGRAA